MARTRLVITQGVFFSAYRRISTDFWPPWDQYKSGEKVDQYIRGIIAFYKHPKLPKNGQKQSFSAPEIHRQNTLCNMSVSPCRIVMTLY